MHSFSLLINLVYPSDLVQELVYAHPNSALQDFPTSLSLFLLRMVVYGSSLFLGFMHLRGGSLQDLYSHKSRIPLLQTSGGCFKNNGY
jgi:hypothetical protein